MSYGIFNLFNAKAYKYTRKNDNDIINNNNNSKDNKLDKKTDIYYLLTLLSIIQKVFNLNNITK